MSPEDALYEVLVCQKILANGAWHVYDEAGNELTHPAGVIWRANPGALLMWPHTVPLTQYEVKQGDGTGGGRPHYLERTSRNSDENAYDRDRVADRLEAVVIAGKTYDPFDPNLIDILEAAAKAPPPGATELERQEAKLARTFTVMTQDKIIEVPLFRPMLREMPAFAGAWSYDFEEYAVRAQAEANEERKRIIMLLTASDWP